MYRECSHEEGVDDYKKLQAYLLPSIHFPLRGCIQPCYFQTGEEYLELRDLTDRSIAANIWILVGMMVIMRILTYLGLRFVRVGKS